MQDSCLKWLIPSLVALRQYVNQVSIDARQAAQLLPAVPVLDALTIRLSAESQHAVDELFTSAQSIKDLSIGALTLTNIDGPLHSETVEALLSGQSVAPKHALKIDSCMASLNFNAVPCSSSVRCVNLIVHHEDILHRLYAHLPNLETIGVRCVPGASEMDLSLAGGSDIGGLSLEETTVQSSVVASKHLRSISIRGSDANLDRLTRLFHLASVSLTEIKLEVSPRSLVVPDQINQVAPHINFKFDVSSMQMGIVYEFDWRSYVDRFRPRSVVRYDNESFCDLSSLREKSVSAWKRGTWLLPLLRYSAFHECAL